MGNAIHRVMSKKRTATESGNDDEQKNEDSDEVFQQVVSAKRGKFDSSSDKTLHDLPLEMLECILVKAIAMEVKGMKLSKSVWKEKADLVINRMRSVCLYWDSILTTNFFRNELHRALDAQKTIRLEILHQSLIQCFVISVTTLKDDVLLFCLYRDQHIGFVNEIRFYDRNNMAEGKEVIPFTTIRPAYVAACNVSNCIYVLEQHRDLFCSSVFHFTRDETHEWKIQTWISDLEFGVSSISVSAKGNLTIIEDSSVVKVYGPNGFLNHEITVAPDIYEFRYVGNVIQRSNGNLVLTSCDQHHRVLTEIDTNGTIVRRYRSSLSGNSGVNFADISGRILITDPRNGIELLDSEFNLLDFTGPQPYQHRFRILNSLHCDSERNEVAGVYTNDHQTSALAISRFIEK